MTKTRKRKLGFVVGVTAIAAGAWWIASDDAPRAWFANALGGNPAQTAKAKPICASPVNPNVAAPVDCIPQYIANLPPDPGKAGKATLDGIDADKDGMRDDVQRWIALEWGHSPLAMKGVTVVAHQYLRAVHYGEDLGKEATRKRFADETMRESVCASRVETQEMYRGRAYHRVKAEVLNTPERRERAAEFDYMFAHGVYDLPSITASEACGFDVDALAAAEGKQTIASQLIAESIERTKRERRERREELERLQKQDPERAKEYAVEIESLNR